MKSFLEFCHASVIYIIYFREKKNLLSHFHVETFCTENPVLLHMSI